MGTIQLFHATLEGARELHETAFENERALQRLFDQHLSDLTGIDFVASEVSTGRRHKRRADTLGLDGQRRPVVIEYKLGRGGGAISQGLDYLAWLVDHKGDFKDRVRDELGNERAQRIDFGGAWLLCVAGEFEREDVESARTNMRRIDLLRVRRHGEATLLFEWVYKKDAPQPPPQPQPVDDPDFSKFRNWEQTVANPKLHPLVLELVASLRSLGKGVWIEARESEFSVKPQRGAHFNVCYFRPRPSKTQISLKIPGQDGPMMEIRNHADLERAKPLLERSYDKSARR